jgi:hypothetical protein
MRQYVLEIEYTLVIENMADDPVEVSDDFIARLTELAASNDHILGLSVEVLPIPELRGSSNRRNATDPEAQCEKPV